VRSRPNRHHTLGCVSTIPNIDIRRRRIVEQKNNALCCTFACTSWHGHIFSRETLPLLMQCCNNTMHTGSFTKKALVLRKQSLLSGLWHCPPNLLGHLTQAPLHPLGLRDSFVANSTPVSIFARSAYVASRPEQQPHCRSDGLSLMFSVTCIS
jgi:hypothetical protein